MATLAAQKIRFYESTPDPVFQDYPAVASDIIYEGAAVSLDGSGNAKPLVVNTVPFVGFATAKADNAGGAAGAVNVRVKTQGIVHIPVGGSSAASVGKDVFGVDDDTFNLTATAQKKIGTVRRFISGTTCAVEIVPTITA